MPTRWARTKAALRLRVLRAVAALAGLTAIGSVAYRTLEDLPWMDAFYLTVVTISTVGFGDFVPVTPAGRYFTTGLIITGVGAALYLISALAEEVLEGRLADIYQRSSRMRKIDRLAGHVIVCGWGRFGKVVVDELVKAGREVVVVECDESLEAELAQSEAHALIGSATVDEVLVRAGVERAESIVVATSSEADSVFITLSARELSPDVCIHARGESDAAIRRLRLAGASFVNSPYQMGGLRTATSILRPSVVDFLELSRPTERSQEIDLEEVQVDVRSSLAGRTVAEVEDGSSKLRIVALKRGGATIELVPDPAGIVEGGDSLVVIGERDQLAQLAERALPQAGVDG